MIHRIFRGTDGVQVIYWYHRQFIETSKRRYLQNETFSRKCHKELAEFFMGIWAGELHFLVEVNQYNSNMQVIIFIHLNLCLATASHKFKWTKLIISVLK